jgi:hypothetical protein
MLNQPVNKPVNQPIIHTVEDVEVNPSASLNEWLVFPSSQDLEVHSCNSDFGLHH